MDFALPILAYHKVDLRRELGVTSLPPQRFEQQIGFLNRQRFVSISPQFLLFNQFQVTTAPANPILITFDDGYEGIYNYAYPILKKYKFSAIVFLSAGYIGKYNSWDASPGPRFKHLNWSHIKEMADNGIWFGSHGVNHTFLTKLSLRAIKHEVEVSKSILEDGLGRPIYFFSYPYGDYDARVISLVREAGYKAAFSLRPELLHNSDQTSAHQENELDYIYMLPRIAVYLVDSALAFKTKVGNVHSNLLFCLQKMKNQLINRCSYASALVKKKDFSHR